ncbi:MAG: phenylalanine--tRNA ligase subunit beta [Deltaproteobacteria bacterium]|nr:phenylalanine--tRNA ligase subunit beta [Deltaproteobacteria bacterium]
MLASFNWIKELSSLEITASEAAERFTAGGIEVETSASRGVGLQGVVIAEVRGRRPHPSKNQLTLVTVFDGKREHEVVCGAPNVPEAGGLVVLAGVGSVLPGGLEIRERKFGEVTSAGMLCSEVELAVGSDESGIIVLDEEIETKCGDPVSEALGLGDTIFEMAITPNRPDCLGHVGLARELCALTGRAFEPPRPPCPQTISGDSRSLYPQGDRVISIGDYFKQASPRVDPHALLGLRPVRVDISDAERCPRYGAALVTNVNNKPSPFCIRYRLHLLGLRAINAVVDATNLIVLGFGHPIHAFDYDKLRDSRILVRLAQPGEVMRTLDGEQRVLTEDDLLICDGKGPVALAGVMGGENSEIGPETKRVLVECAYFDPRSVRRTAKRTSLHTDASYRFERGVDPDAVPTVLAHSVSLIARLAGGVVVSQALDVEPIPYRARSVTLRPQQIESLIGYAVDREAVSRILKAIGCQIEETARGFDVVVPSFRPDIAREVDLIEEVARVQGYEVIPTEMPSARPSLEGTARFLLFLRRIQEAAAAAGLIQAVNFAFVSPEDLETARLSKEAVRLSNPLSEERSALRTSLLPGLVANLSRAQNHQVKCVQQFEVGRVFIPTIAGRLPQEKYFLGILLWGPRQRWYAEEECLDFYDCKGIVNTIIGSLCNEQPTTLIDNRLETAAPYLHPKRSAALRLEEKPIGLIGELHPRVVEAFKLQGRPIYAAVDLEALMTAIEALGIRQFRPLPRFPAVVRDLAVVVAEELPVGDVVPIIREAAEGLAEEVTLFDVYRGAPIKEGKKSLAFRVVYRDPTATLTDNRVEKIHAQVIRATEKHFDAIMRTGE